MRNLLLFIDRFRSSLLFVFFLLLSLSLVIANNYYHKSIFFSTANAAVGKVYAKINAVDSYLHLKETNDSLALENIRLRERIGFIHHNLKIDTGIVSSTSITQKYAYILAEVVNNSIHQKNNFITLNRGQLHGIKKGMGVICSSGIVGIVINVSETFSVVQSLLHKDTRVSAMLEKTKNIGSLIWDNNFNYRKAKLKDVPSHLHIKEGDNVTTSGFSLFPRGIMIGKVSKTIPKSGSYFLEIEILLSTDFSNLQYVYVVTDKFEGERKQLEANNKQE